MLLGFRNPSGALSTARVRGVELSVVHRAVGRRPTAFFFSLSVYKKLRFDAEGIAA